MISRAEQRSLGHSQCQHSATRAHVQGDSHCSEHPGHEISHTNSVGTPHLFFSSWTAMAPVGVDGGPSRPWPCANPACKAPDRRCCGLVRRRRWHAVLPSPPMPPFRRLLATEGARAGPLASSKLLEESEDALKSQRDQLLRDEGAIVGTWIGLRRPPGDEEQKAAAEPFWVPLFTPT